MLVFGSVVLSIDEKPLALPSHPPPPPPPRPREQKNSFVKSFENQPRDAERDAPRVQAFFDRADEAIAIGEAAIKRFITP